VLVSVVMALKETDHVAINFFSYKFIIFLLKADWSVPIEIPRLPLKPLAERITPVQSRSLFSLWDTLTHIHLDVLCVATKGRRGILRPTKCHRREDLNEHLFWLRF
jgi:hypothetical protein